MLSTMYEMDIGLGIVCMITFSCYSKLVTVHNVIKWTKDYEMDAYEICFM